MSDRTCSRCGTSISDPVTANANYVVHDDFVEEEAKEVHYALRHTPQTKQKVQKVADETGRDFDAVAAEMAHPDAPAERDVTVGTERKEHDDGTFVETAKMKTMDFSIPLDEFDREEVDTPEEIKRDDTALVTTNVEQRPVQKTGLICRNCVKDDDQIIWGPDE